MKIVRAKSNKFGQIERFLQRVITLFSQKFNPQKDMIKFGAKKLRQKGLKISFAESCTAGLAEAKFARYGGVSASFDGSLVTYANHIQHEWRGGEDEILDSYGAVSEPCVKAMVNGTLSTKNEDFALAISGIAGPGGGTASKPVGTVYVAAGD
ncbi:CinA family protein, partial [Campylobacter concisus]|uniref:CinA family protein n=1 Tax=Campylobacter concisus TaxID=199 RepID=UPI0021560AD8